MGKNRMAAEAALDRFISEMDAYGKRIGGKGFSMAKRARADIVHAAHRAGQPIERYLDDLKPAITQALEDSAREDWQVLEIVPGLPDSIH